MSESNTPQPPDAADPAAEVRHLFGDRWEITRVTVEVWVAVKRDGDQTRIIAGQPDQLIQKIRTAEDESQ
jgi:hypothetical protein